MLCYGMSICSGSGSVMWHDMVRSMIYELLLTTYVLGTAAADFLLPTFYCLLPTFYCLRRLRIVCASQTCPLPAPRTLRCCQRLAFFDAIIVVHGCCATGSLHVLRRFAGGADKAATAATASAAQGRGGPKTASASFREPGRNGGGGGGGAAEEDGKEEEEEAGSAVASHATALPQTEHLSHVI